jgi:hypothetical protein
MDKAKLAIICNEILSGSGDPFPPLCQLKSWVDDELSTHLQGAGQDIRQFICDEELGIPLCSGGFSSRSLCR